MCVCVIVFLYAATERDLTDDQLQSSKRDTLLHLICGSTRAVDCGAAHVTR